MQAQNNSWHKIANSIGEIDFSNNGIKEIKVLNKNICLVLHKEILYACTPKCPHAGGNMSEGYIDTVGNITCPLHKYKFCLKTGRNVSGEGYYLKMFPIEVVPEGVFIKINDNFNLDTF